MPRTLLEASAAVLVIYGKPKVTVELIFTLDVWTPNADRELRGRKRPFLMRRELGFGKYLHGALLSLLCSVVGFGLLLPLIIKLTNIALLCLLFRYAPTLRWSVEMIGLGILVWILIQLHLLASGSILVSRSTKLFARWMLLTGACCLAGLALGLASATTVFRIRMPDDFRFTSGRYTVTRLGLEEGTLVHRGWKPWKAPSVLNIDCVGRCYRMCPSLKVGATYTMDRDDDDWLSGDSDSRFCLVAITNRESSKPDH
jgi:hypothetical protein